MQCGWKNLLCDVLAQQTASAVKEAETGEVFKEKDEEGYIRYFEARCGIDD